MRLAIMQPYLFPYIGYFQLIHAVDRFVFYDDVNFIKQGWINRNNLLINGKKFLFSLPVENISSFKIIKEIRISERAFHKAKAKLLRTIEYSYKKARFFDNVFPMVTKVLNKDYEYIADYAKESILNTMSYLGIETDMVMSSSIYKNDHLSAADRVMDICEKERATMYINPVGGQQLYDRTIFGDRGLALRFIKTGEIVYPQTGNKFVPDLSIIDVIMHNSKDESAGLLKKYSLI